MEMPIPAQPHRMTEEEYLRTEESSATKHEYRNGEIVDMAGGTFEHADLAANLIREIGIRLKGTNCKALGIDLRVRVPATGSYCYPDVSIVCGPPLFDPPDRRTAISNPRVVIEVTSTSTEAVDRGEKFYDYMRIETLQEYVLVSQDRHWVNTFYRQSDGGWAIGPSAGQLEQFISFRSIKVELQLLEIYSGVELPNAAGQKTEPA